MVEAKNYWKGEISMFCMYCGHSIDENSNFCEKCGQKMGTIPEQQKGEVLPPQQGEPVRTKKGKNRLLIGLLGGGIALVMIAVTVILALWKISPELFNKAEISVIIGEEDLELGSLSENGINVIIPKGASSIPTELTLDAVKNAPDLEKEKGTHISKVYELDIESEDGIKRFEEPLTISFSIDEEQWASLKHPEDICVGYYNGKEWEYIVPLEVNREEGYITFETYHCSWYAADEPTEEELTKEAAHKYAVIKAGADTEKALRNTTEKLVKSVMGEGVDKSLLQDIVEGLMDQNDYTGLVKEAANGTTEQFETQFISCYAQVTAKQLAKYADTAAGALGDVGSSLGLLGSFGDAALLVNNNDYEGAAKKLAEGVISTNPVGKLLVSAAKVTNRQIARWKSEEIEAAYDIYINGKEPTVPFWGYGSIEAGDFDELWNQMRGVRRQIIIDAVKDFQEAQGRAPSEEEIKQIEADAKETLSEEFKERKNKEGEVAKAEEDTLNLLAMMKEANLLETNRFGFDPEKDSYQKRVEDLLKLTEQIGKDTNRNLNMKISDDTEKEISKWTVIKLIMINKSEGEEAYKKALIEMGLVEACAKLSEAEGTYKGTYTFTKVDIPQELLQALEEEKNVSMEDIEDGNVEGCDISLYIEMLKELEGKSGNATILLKSVNGSETSAQVTTVMSSPYDGEEADPIVFDCGYQSGILNGTSMSSEDGVNITQELDFTITKEEQTISMAGNIVIFLEVEGSKITVFMDYNTIKE